MKRILMLAVVLVVAVGGVLALVLLRTPPPVVQSSFAFALFDALPEGESRALSPLSLKFALGMAANGAQGRTLRELLDATGAADLAALNEQARAFITRSAAREAVELNVANSIWHNRDFAEDPALTLSETYQAQAADVFDAEASEIGNADGADTINGWVARQTRGKIDEIVDSGIVADALSILVNTIYFKGDWAFPFRASDSLDGTFTARDGTETTVLFMNQTGRVSYYEDGAVQMMKKPYADDDLAMYLVLPKDDAPLTAADFERAAGEMTERMVELKLPKFKLEYQVEGLTDTLAGMGVRRLFDGKTAELTGLYSKVPPQNPYVSRILQKVVVEVDEKGTEAAAVTGMVVTLTSAISYPEVILFHCDRPFFWLIREESSGEILFMGQYETGGVI